MDYGGTGGIVDKITFRVVLTNPTNSMEIEADYFFVGATGDLTLRDKEGNPVFAAGAGYWTCVRRLTNEIVEES